MERLSDGTTVQDGFYVLDLDQLTLAVTVTTRVLTFGIFDHKKTILSLSRRLERFQFESLTAYESDEK